MSNLNALRYFLIVNYFVVFPEKKRIFWFAFVIYLPLENTVNVYLNAVNIYQKYSLCSYKKNYKIKLNSNGGLFTL